MDLRIWQTENKPHPVVEYVKCEFRGFFSAWKAHWVFSLCPVTQNFGRGYKLMELIWFHTAPNPWLHYEIWDCLQTWSMEHVNKPCTRISTHFVTRFTKSNWICWWWHCVYFVHNTKFSHHRMPVSSDQCNSKVGHFHSMLYDVVCR